MNPAAKGLLPEETMSFLFPHERQPQPVIFPGQHFSVPRPLAQRVLIGL